MTADTGVPGVMPGLACCMGGVMPGAACGVPGLACCMGGACGVTGAACGVTGLACCMGAAFGVPGAAFGVPGAEEAASASIPKALSQQHIHSNIVIHTFLRV